MFEGFENLKVLEANLRIRNSTFREKGYSLFSKLQSLEELVLYHSTFATKVDPSSKMTTIEEAMPNLKKLIINSNKSSLPLAIRKRVPKLYNFEFSAFEKLFQNEEYREFVRLADEFILRDWLDHSKL